MRLFFKFPALILFLTVMGPGPLAAQTMEQAMTDFQAGNYDQALEGWQFLAEKGNKDAAFNLGQMYRLGQGISFDFPKAEENYLIAARAGHTAAQRELGNFYFFTIGTDAARANAIPWWQKAAQNGDPKAQYILGILYFNGDVVKKDRVRGYAWTLLAMDGGVPEALQSNSAMRGQLSEGELEAALKLAPKLMTGTPDQGLYSNLIGEPFPKPRTIITEIKTTETSPDKPSQIQPEEVKTQPQPPLENPPALELAENEIEAQTATIEPLPEASESAFSTPALRAEDPEPQAAEEPLTPDLPVSEPRQEPPSPISPQEYDLGDPKSPLVDEEGFDGAWSVQLTSFRRPENAEAHWREVTESHPEIFDLITKKILRFDLGPEMGVYYRLRIGPFLDKELADAKCAEITEAGLDCLVIWP